MPEKPRPDERRCEICGHKQDVRACGVTHRKKAALILLCAGCRRDDSDLEARFSAK